MRSEGRARIHQWAETGSKLLDRLTRQSTSNFKFAFLFLRPEQRSALEQVYRFCRVVDDIVDERPPGPEGVAGAELGLASWRETIAAIFDRRPYPADLARSADDERFAVELAKSIERFELPRDAFDEIIAGCAMDLDTSVYPTIAELELYCYRVASCVGRLCIGIFGDQSPGAQRYARHLGLALQYTNILRDVGEDAARGRVYLPQDLLARHRLTSKDIFECRYDARFIAMAREFADMAETEYRRAWAELSTVENLRALFVAEIMGRTYYEILAAIRGHRYNVFTFRAALKRRDKLKVAAVSLVLTRLPKPLNSLRAALL